MPKASKETASQVREFPLAVDRSEELEGYSVSFVTIRETHDLTEMLKGLPNDSCQCPHWGYVLKGKITVQLDDREEVYEAGDAFYMPPGHVPGAEEGSEFVQFSPVAQLRETEAAIMANMEKRNPAAS